MAVVLTLAFLVLLWVAAVAFSSDSRDGRDWFSRTNAGDRTPRLGD